MVLQIVGKGDLEKLCLFAPADFERYELYLPVFDQQEILEKVAALPNHIKIGSIHNPTWVLVNGRMHPFDLSAKGVIGEASHLSLLATIELAKKLGSRVIVIHGAAWNIYTQTKEEALNRIARRVLPLIEKHKELSFCFETDILWHNLYFHRRALLACEDDFADLDQLLGGRLKICADFEHLNISYHFSEFVNSFGGEDGFLRRYGADSQKPFEIECQKFIKENYERLQAGFKKHLNSFFSRFQQKIEHIHVNGSDCCNFIFDPKTTLPLRGEHLPIGFRSEELQDRLDYGVVASLLNSLPSQKCIDVVLEVWMKDERDFRAISVESKKYLELKLSFRGETMNTCKLNAPAGAATKVSSVFIGRYELNNFGRPFIIAEIGANHNGNLELAKKMIDAAIAAGADCAKFQSWSKNSLFSRGVYQNNAALEHDIDAYALPLDTYRELKKYCDLKGIMFGTSVFSEKEADFFVDELGLEFIKVASMDVNNLPFLEYLAKKGKPIVLSTGLSTLAEIAEAVAVITKHNQQLVILHCVSVYPDNSNQNSPRAGVAGEDEAAFRAGEGLNINNIEMLRANFAYPIGFSDNTPGVFVPLAAAAKGACLIEKHFTTDHRLEGWDHGISADPVELKAIVDGTHAIRSSLGSYQRVLTAKEQNMIPIFRRSVVTTRTLPAGSVLSRADLDFKRPGTGIAPKDIGFVIGRQLKRALLNDELVRREDLV